MNRLLISIVFGVVIILTRLIQWSAWMIELYQLILWDHHLIVIRLILRDILVFRLMIFIIFMLFYRHFRLHSFFIRASRVHTILIHVIIYTLLNHVHITYLTHLLLRIRILLFEFHISLFLLIILTSRVISIIACRVWL